MSRELNIAVLGATGAVGETIIEILVERQFPVAKLFPLGSERSAGKFHGEKCARHRRGEF
jgi:aspartate-semialdehyde dehydrogenase